MHRALAAGLFILQTYIAALLIGDRTEFVGDSAMNDAFYTVSALVGGSALKVVVAVAAALSAAIANALVAQAATARLLFAWRATVTFRARSRTSIQCGAFPSARCSLSRR